MFWASYFSTKNPREFLLLFTQKLHSQKHIGNFDQLFLTGTQTPAQNIDAFLLNTQIERDEVVDKYFYRLIQFFEVPTEEEKRDVVDAGILLFDYLPHRTYVAALPENFSKDKFRDLNIRSITTLKWYQKISPTITNEEKVVLQYFPNISPDDVNIFLGNKGVEIYRFFETINSVEICKGDLETIANFPITFFISPSQNEVLPEYIPSKNIHRSNVLAPQINGYPQFKGDDINIAIGDDGMIENHIDFKNRIFQGNVLGDLEGTHGEMVAGILAGAGNLDPQMEGTASHSNIFMVDKFETITIYDELYNNREIVLTSTSYSDGCNRGYTSLAQLADQQIRNNNALMHVFSAGNTGNEDCGYGAAEGWGNITGGVKMGKNVLTVANVDENDFRPNSSSRGPANDGRIKPDISANGDGQISTQPNNTYGAANGSSAAAPGVAGVLAQLYQSYAASHSGNLPNSALMKAVILNTADDLGNPGPDFSYGFGRINARRAHNVIHNEQYFENILGHSNTHSYFVDIPQGTKQVRIMLYWNDIEGSTISSPALVNDLDLRVSNSSGDIFLPWVLNSSPDSNLLNLPAVRGVDHLNNVEQVTIDLPESGLHSFLVDGSIVAHGNQNYFLVYEFIQNEITVTYPMGGEKIIPGSIEKIHWDAHGNFGNFEISLSYNNGLTWNTIGLVPGDKRSFLWETPKTSSNQFKIRVKRNNVEDESIAPFTIYEVPKNIHIAEVCPEMVRMEWDAVANAESYQVFRLGEKYMEPFSTVTEPFIEISISDPSKENWYAVASKGGNGLISQRSIAINDGTNLINCDLGTDISIHSIATPSNSILQSCFQNPMTVSVNITNSGNAMQLNVPIFYQMNNQAIVAENYIGSIPPGVTVNYTFNQKIPPANIGYHLLKVWTAQPNDQATFNNEMDFSLEVIGSSTAGLPYSQNFDSFDNCDPNADCDAPCFLQSGWHNDLNQISDDTDWIVYQGATPTSGTGPSFDQNQNNKEGKYLYLEGSRGCTEKESYLLSPCFDLTSVTQPTFSFWYYMFGQDIGRLHVDLFDGETWYFNIMPTLTGEQNDDWQEVEIDLTAFLNKTVNIRFRGVTGEDFLTDIAIDNVALFDAHSAPYPNFKSNKTFTCPSQKVQFIDNSVNSPTQWEWIFSPSTVSFTEGTTAHDENPVVIFEANGNYNVTLITTNGYGSSQITKQEYIHISNGKNISFGDDFNDVDLDFGKWYLKNNDKSTTWSTVQTIGRDGFSTQAIYMNNHSYNADGETDELESIVIDLTETEKPFLRFDWAYTQFNSTFADGLQVVLSSDCGENFDHIIFNKHGEELATTQDQIAEWFPKECHDWKTAKIDLSNFIGSSISIRFINTNGFGNNLFLDNFLVYEYHEFPNASLIFHPEENTICLGDESITFLTTSQTENEFLWNFGEKASPNIVEGYGPHVVNFTETGTHHVSLRVKNELGYDMAETTINVIDDPIADFEYSLMGQVATFNNLSIFGENYHWDFGDGTTSNLESPTHEYQLGNAVTAELTVTNKCGEHTASQTLIIFTGTDDLENNFFIKAFPNPTDELIQFQMPSLNQSEIIFDIIDVRGSIVASFDLKERGGLFSHQLNVTNLAQGMYFARAQVNGKIFVKRFVRSL